MNRLAICAAAGLAICAHAAAAQTKAIQGETKTKTVAVEGIEQANRELTVKRTPAVTSSRQQTITATIAAIDPTVPSVTFTGPNGWKYSGRVEDKKALERVKVGDRFDITWTEALLLSIDEPKSSRSSSEAWSCHSSRSRELRFP